MKHLDGWESEKRKLSATAVSKTLPSDKTIKLADGYGLSLVITPNGRRYWRYNYRFAGKQKTLALGTFPEITLSEARNLHREAYNQVLDNIDPSVARKNEKVMRNLSAINTFEAIANEWLDAYMIDKTEGTKARAVGILKNDIFPSIGSHPIKDITALELLATLRRIEGRGANSVAHRARNTCKQIYSYAIATGRCERNIAQDLQGTLRPAIAQHRAAILDPKLLGKLLRDIDSTDSGIVVKTAMQISPILFQRPGEIRQMEWSEIDFEKAVWEIPAQKMKMRNDHIVPLPTQVVHLLKQLHPITKHSPYVFPSARGASRCLSDNAVRVGLRDLGYSKEVVTPHGFRATARTLLDETLGYRPEYIEHQLAHAVKDPNGRAYNRTSFLEQRHEMMQAWADYLDKLKAEAKQVSPNL